MTDRISELGQKIRAYADFKESFLEKEARLALRRKKIRELYSYHPEDWGNWNWQMENRIQHPKRLQEVMNPAQSYLDEARANTLYRWAVTPYYASLMNTDDVACPIARMVLPSIQEVANPEGELDPMAEGQTSPAPCVTQRYPDRLILNVTNVCPAFCRFCQRRRNIGSVDAPQPIERVKRGIDYIRNNPNIRDVLVTGGDPLTLPDDVLESILGEIRTIRHVEIIRVGSRVLATLPQRITDGLCRMLKKFHPLYLSTHYNHPLEVTEESATAAARLADAGIGMNNQSVLLRGVNDQPFLLKLLFQRLLAIRVRPYYLFHPKSITGTHHFACSIDDGLKIMQELRGFTSGLAIPTYVYNAPGGLGKIPLGPCYVLQHEHDRTVMRTWEGKVIEYKQR
jgi:lysine 2,3-aminomutase